MWVRLAQFLFRLCAFCVVFACMLVAAAPRRLELGAQRRGRGVGRIDRCLKLTHARVDPVNLLGLDDIAHPFLQVFQFLLVSCLERLEGLALFLDQSLDIGAGISAHTDEPANGWFEVFHLKPL